MIDLAPGVVVGQRVLLRVTSSKRRGVVWLVRCACGNESKVPAASLRQGYPRTCRDCHNRSQRPGVGAPTVPEFTPSLLQGSQGHPYHLNDLPFEDDPEAQRFVEENPSGATLSEIGACLGVTRERVRQIEEEALRKLNAAVRRDSGQGISSAHGASERTHHSPTPSVGRGGQR